MSFILDALKKSDRKRQDTSAPRLDTVHRTVVTKRRRPLWLYFLLTILLLNLGALSWFFIGEQPPQGEDSQQPSAAVSSAPQPVRPAVPATAATPIPTISARSASAPQQPVAEPEPLPGDRVYLISELPAAVQRRIPSLTMSLHAYNKANPAAGMVRINEQILRQGAKLDGKYLLEEINADGVVFRFDGYRFLLPRG